MDFAVTVTHETRFARVRVEGPSGVGRLLSLLQVLEVDCRSWRESAVLVDLRELQPALSEREQVLVAAAAARAFAPLARAGFLVVSCAAAAMEGVRCFTDEARARDWLDVS
jgi:hypothetical protein